MKRGDAIKLAGGTVVHILEDARTTFCGIGDKQYPFEPFDITHAGEHCGFCIEGASIEDVQPATPVGVSITVTVGASADDVERTHVEVGADEQQLGLF